eukprot:13551739-Alexandrium_andersonii.AAC.1
MQADWPGHMRPTPHVQMDPVADTTGTARPTVAQTARLTGGCTILQQTAPEQATNHECARLWAP